MLGQRAYAGDLNYLAGGVLRNRRNRVESVCRHRAAEIGKFGRNLLAVFRNARDDAGSGSGNGSQCVAEILPKIVYCGL